MNRRQLVGRSAVGLATALLLAACGGGESSKSSEIAFTRLSQDLYGEWPSRTYTIRTEADWRKAWEEHDTLTIPPRPAPSVDFTQTMLLGVSAGWGPVSCSELRINRVHQDADTLVVEYRVADTSRAGGTCGQALSPLFDLVQVSVSDLPVKFIQVSG